MENAYQPELWQNVYVVLGSSSAALIGLLFIATSLHLDEIINNLGLRRRAFNNTRYLLMIFVEALLIPCLSGFLPIRLPGESCLWRIRKSSHKCIGAGSLVRYRHRATVDIDDSPAHSCRPPVGHHRQTRAPGRSTRRRGRILVAKAPVAHQ